MTTLIVGSDDDFKVFFNPDAICMFRVRKGADGEIAEPREVEIEFMGGAKTKLFGDVAKHFLSGMSQMMP